MAASITVTMAMPNKISQMKTVALKFVLRDYSVGKNKCKR